MMKQIEFAQRLVEHLCLQGVKRFALCAGARNSPLVSLIAESRGLEVFHFFNENSCAFFALGYIKKTNEPFAVLTTSGTAVAELLPAVIEAHYTCLPLVVVTADRPVGYRGSGAPQSIEQVGIFGNYVDECFELEALTCFEEIEKIRVRQFPIHVNICFDEPLLGTPTSSVNFSEYVKLGKEKRLHTDLNKVEIKEELEAFLGSHQRPVVIVGELSTQERAWVEDFLKSSGVPVFAESLSGLSYQEDQGISYLFSGDVFVQNKLRQGYFDSVLRVGGVPTLRAWRDLESSLESIPVMSISSRPFSGLSKKRRVLPIGEWLSEFSFQFPWSEKDLEKLLQEDEGQAKKLEELFQRFPQSELGLFYSLGQGIIESDRVYVGNSMPIRQWDLVHRFRNNGEIAANRGANGIDGQVSTFLGWSQQGKPNWALLGDLTSLYDQSGLWASRYVEGDLRLVIINNSGGRIFSRIFDHPAFLNEHDVEFSGWAKMWGLDYQCWSNVPGNLSELPSKILIELKPDLEETQRFWNAYKEIWN